MKIKKILMLLMLLLIPMIKVDAASFNLSSSSKTVVVGSNVTIYVNGSDVTGRVNVASSDTTVLSSGSNSVWIEPKGSITFKANKVGTATITVSAASLSDSEGNDVNLGSQSITIKVVEKSSYNTNKTPTKTASSNNSLSSLSVEGATLSPEFDSGTTEYSLTMPKGTENINILATPADNKANVNGTGLVPVTEGLNIKNIVVTAENGYQKTYILNVTVEEDPIIVKVNNVDYNMVKKENALPQTSSYYSPTTVNYKYEDAEYEIPAYYSEITGYTLVGLKDSSGKIELYIYDKESKKFTLYNELNFNNNIILYCLDSNDIPEGYKKIRLDFNDEEIVAYQKNKASEFYLLYGMNVDTGEIGWYHYDKKDMSIQRYDNEEINELLNLNSKYMMVIMVLGGSCLLLMIAILILMVKIKKQQKES